jgi:16S rRNA G966 N2-methylase RsmD
MKTKFLWAIRAIQYTLISILYEFPRGIDFSMRDKNSNIGLNNRDLNGYAMTSKNALKNLLIHVDIKNKNFIDIGSGKGAVVYNAMKQGAKFCVGIEYNYKLHKIAVSNFKRLFVQDKCHSINIDACIYKNYFEFDIYYLFNPFSDQIYKEVMNSINSQIKHDKKTRWIIAYGKSNKSAIMDVDNINLIKHGICPYRNTEFNIYKIN